MPYQHRKPVEPVAYSLSKAAAATELRIERLTAAIRSGELRSHRIATKTRVTADALRTWIESHPPASREARHAA
jgi:hypothetical protein